MSSKSQTEEAAILGLGGKESISKLTRIEGNDVCADCGEAGKFLAS